MVYPKNRDTPADFKEEREHKFVLAVTPKELALITIALSSHKTLAPTIGLPIDRPNLQSLEEKLRDPQILKYAELIVEDGQ